MTVHFPLIDLQTGLFETPLTPHAQVGFELGWDYAHHLLAPPRPYGSEPSPLHSGLVAGRAAFGARTLPAGRYVRRWLQLRLHAWLRGRSLEPVQVTPNFLQQIDVPRCPITRALLADGEARAAETLAAGSAADAAVAPSIDRVRDDAGYAASNLATLSRRANHAKGQRGRAEALEIARRLDADVPGAVSDGLGAAEWARIAALCSFVTPMSHAEACRAPMRVLPPNRLRLFNPAQALQAFVGRQFLKPGWSERSAAFTALLPGEGLRRDFQAYIIALAPRVIEAGGIADATRARWAVEDAAALPRVQERWVRFAGPLDPAACEALLMRASGAGLAVGAVLPLSECGATDGWALASRGYLPHRTPAPDAGGRQTQLAW